MEPDEAVKAKLGGTPRDVSDDQRIADVGPDGTIQTTTNSTSTLEVVYTKRSR